MCTMAEQQSRASAESSGLGDLRLSGLDSELRQRLREQVFVNHVTCI